MTVSSDELVYVWWGLVVLLGVQLAFGQMRCAFLDKLHLQRRLQHLFSGIIVLHFQRMYSTDVSRLFLVSAIIFTLLAHKSRQYVPVIQRIFVRSFNSILRKPEAYAYQTPGAVHFLLGNLISIALYSRDFCSLVIIAISFGDPVAGLFGILIPSRRIVGSKTLAGFLGCALASGPVLLLAWTHWNENRLSGLEIGVLLLLFGLTTAVAELFVILDDNISMPVLFGAIFRLMVYLGSSTIVGPLLYEIYTS